VFADPPGHPSLRATGRYFEFRSRCARPPSCRCLQHPSRLATSFPVLPRGHPRTRSFGQRARIVCSLLISSISSRLARGERSWVSRDDFVPHRAARSVMDVEKETRNSAGSPLAIVARSSKLHLSRNRCGKSFILPWKWPRRWSENPNGSD